MSSEREDREAIRDLIENWVLYRDAGLWERFRTVWHEEGWMNATWFQGPFEDFIQANVDGWKRGIIILHFLGGMTIDLAGERAFTQTKMTISQRGPLDGVECDIVCTGRFCDFVERRQGRWGIVVRQPIYERDRANPVDPSAELSLDRALLERFPSGYRHLAYLQTQAGYAVKGDMPAITGPEVEELYARGRAWLAGEVNNPREERAAPLAAS
jgi:SnoaL-like domain